jgi:predicted naringenin-chalcone synthase
MVSAILGLGTAVPAYEIDQEVFAANLGDSLGVEPRHKELLLRLFKNSRIKKRYSAIPDYQNRGIGGSLYSNHFPQEIPFTIERNEIYKNEAPQLALQASQKALSHWRGDSSKITHVISVSCTGMMAPGIEFLLIEKLGLKSNCTRLGVNFMGCFGAFQGMAAARAFSRENPNHRILVVCTELCSLHMQGNHDISSFISNALFADGAAAIIVGAQPNVSEKPFWEICNHSSFAMDDSLQEMTWEIGNHGFIMNLSEKVPKSIKRNIEEFIKDLIGKDRSIAECSWAVHPGGKAILLAIAETFKLNSDQDLSSSWHVLENFGNMSSASFLFVLEHLLAKPNPKKWSLGLGFGPGLALEGVLLKNVF